MAYHTGAYNKIQGFLKDKLIKEIRGFQVWEYQGRWYLVNDDYKISELVNGKESFDKNYKSDFNYWIDKIREKDKKKVAGIRAKMDILQKDIASIELLWLKNNIYIFKVSVNNYWIYLPTMDLLFSHTQHSTPNPNSRYANITNSKYVTTKLPDYLNLTDFEYFMEHSAHVFQDIDNLDIFMLESNRMLQIKNIIDG